jgi:hypothetical protein
VYTDEAGVVLRSWFRHRRFDWRSVNRFEVVDGWPYVPTLVLVGGRRVRALGLGPTGVRNHASMEQTRALVADLNAEAQGHRGQS